MKKPRQKQHWKNLSLNNIVEEIDGIVYTEKWEDVKNYEGLYMVSNFGRIRSMGRPVYDKKGVLHYTQNELIMKQQLNGYVKGYPFVNLRKDGKYKPKLVHRAVIETFIENINKKPFANHKDGVKTNGFFKNLEWVTKSENEKHAYAVLGKKGGLYGLCGAAHFASVPILKLKKDGTVVKRFVSFTEAEKNGFSRFLILSCLNGAKEFYKGYKWRYG